MTNEQIINRVEEIARYISRDNLNKYIRNHYPDLYNEIMLKTSNLDKFDDKIHKNKKISIFERLYCIKNHLSDRPKCKFCKTNYVNGFIKTENRYRKWCCPKCQASDPDSIMKSKKTRYKKYGNENYNGLELAKSTRMKHYGGKWCPDDFAEKIRKTKFERYGDENFVNKEKAISTSISKYGRPWFTNNKKAKETKLNRYGDKNYNNAEKIKKSLSKNPISKENKIKAIKQRSFEILRIRTREYIPLFSKEDYIENRIPKRKWKWKHLNCGTVFDSEYKNGMLVTYCPKCYIMNSISSKPEEELVNFVRAIYDGTILHKTYANRHIIPNLRELDIVIPDKKLAIEFDGLYFHSSKFKDSRFHLNKTLDCEKSGYRLIHVFEDEWLGRKSVVKNRLKYALGKSKYKIHARKCTVIRLDSHKKDLFLSKYHLSGTDKSIKSYGLKFNGHLVAVMTFIKSRFDKTYEWEISRYATVANFRIVGGAGKMLKCFKKDVKPQSIIAYSDKRWGEGRMYEKIGFKFIRKTKPSYFFLNGCNRISRLDYSVRKKIKPGQYIIHDCGNNVYGWKI